MKSRGLSGICFLLLFFCWPLAARAEVTSVKLRNGSIELAQGPWDGSTASVRVTATSSKETRLSFVFIDNIHGSELQAKTYILDLPAGRTLRRTLWMSSPARFGSFKLRVEEAGSEVHISHLSKGAGFGMPLRGLAITSPSTAFKVKRLAGTLTSIQSAETQEERWTREQAEREGGSTAIVVPRRLDGRQNHLELETLLPPEAPEIFRGYRGYDMVLLDDPVDNALSAAQAEALIQYTLSGGTLVWFKGESSSGSRQMTALCEALGLARNSLGLCRGGRGWVLVMDTACFRETSDAALREKVLTPLLDIHAYIRGEENNDYHWYRRNPREVFNEVVTVMTEGLFEPPGWLSVLILFILIVVTVGPLNRYVLKRRGLTALYPVTVAAISILWLGVIYAVGVVQHGLGTTTRRFVVWDQWKGDLGLQTESLCLFTSFGTNLNLKTTSPTIIQSLTESFIELRDDGDLHLEDAPLHIWSPAIFEASRPLKLGGRIRFEDGNFINETPQDFEFAVGMHNGVTFFARHVPAGEKTAAKKQSVPFDSMAMKDLGLSDEVGHPEFAFIQLCRSDPKAIGRNGGIMAFGRQAPTLLEDAPKADEVYALYFGGFDE